MKETENRIRECENKNENFYYQGLLRNWGTEYVTEEAGPFIK